MYTEPKSQTEAGPITSRIQKAAEQPMSDGTRQAMVAFVREVKHNLEERKTVSDEDRKKAVEFARQLGIVRKV